MIFQVFSFGMIGALMGLLSGLLGIGGGIVTIPCLLFVFSYMDIPPSAYMHLAIGTSLSAMVVSSLSGSYTHYKKGAVLFSIVKPMSLGILVGALIGATLVRLLPSYFLQIFFGSFELLLGVRFLLPDPKVQKEHPIPSFWPLSAISAGVATLSTMLGVGGGLLNVPILTHFNVPMKNAIGTSSALSFLIALCGTASILLIGSHTSSVPDTVGYLYMPAFISISIVSFFAAPYGARLAHRLQARILKKGFGVILLVAGLVMIIR